MNSIPPKKNEVKRQDAFNELERALVVALSHYANVHRGSGHASRVTTELYEQAREIVLAHLGLQHSRFRVIFCSPFAAERILDGLKTAPTHILSSDDLGLPLGVRAIVLPKRVLQQSDPIMTGGGTARLVGPEWVIWARGTDRFEAGTPAIVNVIAFAKALLLSRQHGEGIFAPSPSAPQGPDTLFESEESSPLAAAHGLEQLKEQRIGLGLPVPTLQGLRPFINFDNAASTPTLEPVWEVVRRTWRQGEGQRNGLVTRVKAVCARVLNAPADRYDSIFCTNTTEAINQVVELTVNRADPDEETVVLNTLLEHNSNELPWRTTPGLSHITLPVDRQGLVDLALMESLLHRFNNEKHFGNKRIRLIAISGASNVLGTCNDIVPIARLAHRHGALLLVDAAQLVPHRAVDCAGWGVDYLVFSGHKLYAPFGSGLLLVNRSLTEQAQGRLSRLRESGEENLCGIAALGRSLQLLHEVGMEQIEQRERSLMARLLKGLADLPGIRILGAKDSDSPDLVQKTGLVSFYFQGIMAGRVARELAERGGIGTRFGCHCAHLLVKHLLDIPAWGERIQRVIVRLLPGFNLPGVVRVSLGIENSEEEIDELIRVLTDIAHKKRVPRAARLALRQEIDRFVQAAVDQVYAR